MGPDSSSMPFSEMVLNRPPERRNARNVRQKGRLMKAKVLAPLEVVCSPVRPRMVMRLRESSAWSAAVTGCLLGTS